MGRCASYPSLLIRSLRQSACAGQGHGEWLHLRSTIASMGGPPCIPLRRSNREAAGVDGGETLEVRLDLDTDKREVKPPADFMKALKAAHPAWHRWRELSYSHQREYAEAIEEAKKPETRARRIEVAVRAIRAKREKLKST